MSIQVVASYTLPPGCCLVCAQPRTPAVSTGIDIHQPGRAFDSEVVICHTCVLEMARVVGAKVGYVVISVAERNQMADVIAELTNRIVELNDERDLAYAARNALLDSLAKRDVPTAAPIEEPAPASAPPPKRAK